MAQAPKHYSLTCCFLKFLNIKFRKGHYNKTLTMQSPGIVTTTIIFQDDHIVIVPIDPLSGPAIYLVPEKTTDIINAMFQWELFPLNKYTINNYFNSCLKWN